MRDGGDERVPRRGKCGRQPQPVRGRRGATTGRGAFIVARSRTEHRRFCDRNAAQQRRRGSRLGVQPCGGVPQHHRGRNCRGYRFGTLAGGSGCERFLSLQAELLRLPQPERVCGRHLGPPGWRRERPAAPLRCRHHGGGEPSRNAARGHRVRGDDPQQVWGPRRMDLSLGGQPGRRGPQRDLVLPEQPGRDQQRHLHDEPGNHQRERAAERVARCRRRLASGPVGSLDCGCSHDHNRDRDRRRPDPERRAGDHR